MRPGISGFVGFAPRPDKPIEWRGSSYDDLCAFPGIAQRDAAADPGTCAGHDRDVVLQKSGHVRFPPTLWSKHSDQSCRGETFRLHTKGHLTG